VSGPSITIEQILTLLRVGPSQIAEATAGLTETQLHAAPSPGEWSANEVLAHLRSCADVWGNCIVTILNQDRPTIRAVNPRTWIKKTDYPEQKFQPSLQAYTVQRKELLASLEALKPKAWLRLAVVRGAGKPLELTIHSYAERMAIHERPHLKQIRRIADTLRVQRQQPHS
jgi:DinB family protein